MSILIDSKTIVQEAKRRYSALNVTYDKENDVLYIRCAEPHSADDSKTIGDYIYRYNRGKLVGITILEASENYQNGFK